MSQKTVENFDVHVHIEVVQYDDGMFDWYADNGDESNELFETQEEAAADARWRYN